MMVKMSGQVCDDDMYDVESSGVDEEDREELEDDQEEQEGEQEQDGNQVEADDESKPEACSDKLLAELAEAERICERREREVNRCRADLKLAKADFDSAVSKLRRLAKAVKDDEERPLMPAFKAADAVADSTTETASDPDESSVTWRDAPISDLALPDALLDRLYDVGIETVGDLEDLRAEISQGKGKWPKGVGPAKVTQIEDAVLQWLAVNQE